MLNTFLMSFICQGKQVQTGFQKGMERILGVDEKHVATKGTEALGEDTAAADLQSDETGNDLARTRYQRLFWEPVVEGQVSLRLSNTSPVF